MCPHVADPVSGSSRHRFTAEGSARLFQFQGGRNSCVIRESESRIRASGFLKLFFRVFNESMNKGLGGFFSPSHTVAHLLGAWAEGDEFNSGRRLTADVLGENRDAKA